MRRLRVTALVIAAIGIGAFGASGSASAAVSADGASSRAASSQCVGPCPIVLFKKGNGGGRVWSSPPGIDCPATCSDSSDVLDDVFGIRLSQTPSPGSTFMGWQGCPEVPSDGTCWIPPGNGGSGLVICATFVQTSSPLPGPAECPPQSPQPPPPPPPPPPTGPPPVGSKCTIVGSQGPDVIRGTSGSDVICGRGGADTINAGGGHDLVVGGKGNDRITGGPGKDTLLGGPGRDTLYARDRARDTVNGGPGRDRARVDRRDVVKSVERRF
jgi:hypothetical protein